MDSSEFRKELVKIMPGYQWTVHKPLFRDATYLCATGIQTSGFNRLSTLEVVRRDRSGAVEYEVKSSGFGTKAPWLSTATDGTLARALRSLQTHYEHRAAAYSSHAWALQNARKEADGNPRTRLLAVAPELLSELESIVEAFAGTEYEQVFDDARALIANVKETGAP